MGNYTEAIQYYDKALSISPINIVVYHDKANALFNLGNYTEAIQYYDKVLKINPNDGQTVNNKHVAQTYLISKNNSINTISE